MRYLLSCCHLINVVGITIKIDLMASFTLRNVMILFWNSYLSVFSSNKSQSSDRHACRLVQLDKVLTDVQVWKSLFHGMQLLFIMKVHLTSQYRILFLQTMHVSHSFCKKLDAAQLRVHMQKCFSNISHKCSQFSARISDKCLLDAFFTNNM